MKAIKMRIQKSSRPLVIFLAIVVAILTSMVVANATQTITTPNAMYVTFSLATGGTSAAITPANNKSVLVMGCCTTAGRQSVGQVSLLRVPSIVLQWTGLESNGPAAITSGGSNTANTHIVYIDSLHKVEIESASVDTIRVHNADTVTRDGNVTLIW
jgi:hypothetical protein